MSKRSPIIIYGINPVFEALRSGSIKTLYIGNRRDARTDSILRLAVERDVPLQRVSVSVLDRKVNGVSHQGVVAELSGLREHSVKSLVAEASAHPLLVVLDGIEDPQNVGAILRTVAAAGADGLVHQTRRAAPFGGAVAKASAGALVHVKISSVVNIARTLEELKQSGVWTIGLAGDAALPYDAVDLTLPTAFVIGSEGRGLRRLIRERCDHLVSIPMRGKVENLNASVALGIALFEAVRQRNTIIH